MASVRPPPPDAGYEMDVKSDDTAAPEAVVVPLPPPPPPRERSPLMRKNVSEDASTDPVTTARRLPHARACCAAARLCRRDRTSVRRATSATTSGSDAGAGAAAWPSAAAAGKRRIKCGLSVTHPTYAAGAAMRKRYVSWPGVGRGRIKRGTDGQMSAVCRRLRGSPIPHSSTRPYACTRPRPRAPHLSFEVVNPSLRHLDRRARRHDPQVGGRERGSAAQLGAAAARHFVPGGPSLSGGRG